MRYIGDAGPSVTLEQHVFSLNTFRLQVQLTTSQASEHASHLIRTHAHTGPNSWIRQEPLTFFLSCLSLCMYDNLEEFPSNNNVDRCRTRPNRPLLQSLKPQATDINARVRVELLENDSIKTSLWSIKDQVEMIGNPDNAAIDTHEQQDRLRRTCKKNQTGKCSKEPT
jgi:hypothetical protein